MCSRFPSQQMVHAKYVTKIQRPNRSTLWATHPWQSFWAAWHKLYESNGSKHPKNLKNLANSIKFLWLIYIPHHLSVLGGFGRWFQHLRYSIIFSKICPQHPNIPTSQHPNIPTSQHPNIPTSQHPRLVVGPPGANRLAWLSVKARDRGLAAPSVSLPIQRDGFHWLPK